MLVTTTNSLEGYKISSYYGIVTGEAIIGTNIVRDMFASISDVIGGRSGVYEEKLAQARQIALDEMSSAAAARGANGVIGVDLDYEVIREGMMMVTACGTAVYTEKV